jgi:hypothetical protein
LVQVQQSHRLLQISFICCNPNKNIYYYLKNEYTTILS